MSVNEKNIERGYRSAGINWFPGHMAKSMRAIAESAKLVDGAIYVLDSRAPFSCVNPKLTEIFANKPILYALNKSDLIENSDLKRVQAIFRERGELCYPVVGTNKKTVLGGIGLLRERLKEKVERNKLKGDRPLRFMVIGIPNTGKSTLINSLCPSKRAQTGDKAGVTKTTQWIKLEGLELLDTPGTMPPHIETQEIAKRLAFIGSINDDILNKEDLCLDLINVLKEIAPEKLSERYKINADNEGLKIYEEICKNRGFLLRGGDFDYTRCATSVIDDFRKGRIGKICLE